MEDPDSGKQEGREDAQQAAGNDSAAPGAGERSWQNLLDLDARMFQQKKIRLLTPEARVLINLKLNGSLSVMNAMELAGVSYRGFYAVLERLKRAGLIAQARDKEDQRVRKLSLDASVPLPPDSL